MTVPHKQTTTNVQQASKPEVDQRASVGLAPARPNKTRARTYTCSTARSQTQQQRGAGRARKLVRIRQIKISPNIPFRQI